MTTGDSSDDARRAAMAASWRAVALTGLSDEAAVRGALIEELRARGVVDPTDLELDGLVMVVRTPGLTGFRLLRDQVRRRVELFREMADYRQPRWSLPPRGVPSPPEPDLSSTEIAATLGPPDLLAGRAVLSRVIDVLGDHGDDEPERDLSPWVSREPGGVGVHVGSERVGTIPGDQARQFGRAIDRWGKDTGTLCINATLHGDDVATAELRIFVSLPTDG